MGQIVVDLLHLAFAVWIVLVILRTASQAAKKRAPVVSHVIEYGIGK